MSITKEQITAALRKLGPSTPDALAAHLDCTRNALMYHVKSMLADKALHEAGNRLNRIIALPDQKIDQTKVAPPQERKPKKSKKSKRGSKKAAKHSAPPARATAEPEFLPAFTADDRLVLVHGTQPAQIFTPEQTQGIATLLINHFEA